MLQVNTAIYFFLFLTQKCPKHIACRATAQWCHRLWTLWESSSQITIGAEDPSFHLTVARVVTQSLVLWHPTLTTPELVWFADPLRWPRDLGMLGELPSYPFFMILRKLQDLLLGCKEFLFLLMVQTFWTMDTLDKGLSRKHRLISF